MKRERSFLDFLVRRGRPVDLKSAAGMPLEKPVEVYADRLGIPHIFAQSEKDLFTAQGFIHAADRLWQMESIRRLAAGTLAEIAGEELADLDHFCRIAGFSRMRDSMIAALNGEERSLFAAYAEGINAYIKFAGKNLPLEFRILKCKPAPWQAEDLAGAMPLNAWFLQTNYTEEILALLTRKNMTEELWNELYAVYPGETPPPENFFKQYGKAVIGPLIPAALSFYPALKGVGTGREAGVIPGGSTTGGSNNWAVVKGINGKPVLANDPHLDNSLPQIWHFCHMSCPGLNVCGGSLPGVPGVIIGRNEQVAWGLTNLMTDCCDLFIVDLDPGNPARYKVKGVYHDMKKETGVIKIAGGKEREVTTWHTMYGPVITELSPGVEAAAALCWYGTHSSAGDPDTTLRAVFAMDKARNTEDMVAAAKLLQTVGMNVVEADTGGSIAWFASGRIPRRRGYSGRLPADGSTGGCSWEGFVPPDENPSAINPASGFIATANHKTAPAGYPHKVTHSWAAPYRHRRIVELLGREKAHSPDSFAAIQKDVYSKRAEVFLPVLLGFSYAGKEAREAAGMLKDWDLSMGADSRGGLLFQVFLNRFAEILCKDLLGEYLPVYTIFSHLFFSALDALFDSAAGGRVPGKKQRQLLGGRDLAALCEEALGGSIRFIEKALGRNRKTWSWGRLHRYYYRHPGARGGLAERLLNRGPYPAPGSTDTINLGFYNPAKKGPPANQFEVTAIPSLRFLTDLADADSSRIMGPMGQSGRPGTLHYADMMKHWMKVEYVSLPLSREKSVEISVQKTVLEP